MSITVEDPSELQQQEQAKQDSEKTEDDGGGDADSDGTFGLINAGPIKLKDNLEKPVTSGGMDIFPGLPDPTVEH